MQQFARIPIGVDVPVRRNGKADDAPKTPEKLATKTTRELCWREKSAAENLKKKSQTHNTTTFHLTGAAVAKKKGSFFFNAHDP